MNNQEIIDNAPAKQGKWPDCNQVDSDGKWSHRQPLIRSLADIKRIVELENALKSTEDMASDLNVQIAELEKGMEKASIAVSQAFPCLVSCDNVLIVTVPAYNKIVAEFNALKELKA